jgi:hypothetical protein
MLDSAVEMYVSKNNRIFIKTVYRSSMLEEEFNELLFRYMSITIVEKLFDLLNCNEAAVVDIEV